MQKQINREFYKYISLNVLGMLGPVSYTHLTLPTIA